MSAIRLQGETEKSRGIYYQLDSNDKPIGVGGMGQVFKGVCVNEHTGSTSPVAIKFMFDDLPPHAIERARREASIQLRNDNLVEMLGFIEIKERTPIGEVKTHYHVVSELLTGVSLSDLMDGKTTDRDGMPIAFAEKLLADYKNDSEHFARIIVMNVMSGLMALHDAGYIHRDIDPSNIMVTNDGHIKLIDFGIAKQMNTLTTNDKGLTVAGKFLGKPEYAAPELVLGDIRHQNQTTDIYAMGILLYQCIVGHTPFEGPRHEILEHQLKTKLPLDKIKNKSLRKIIAKACEKKQDMRYQTISQMRVALETASNKPTPVPLPSITSKVWKVAAVAVVAAFLTGTGAYFLSQSSKSDPTPQPVVASQVIADASSPGVTANEPPSSEAKDTETPAHKVDVKDEQEQSVPRQEPKNKEKSSKDAKREEAPKKEAKPISTTAPTTKENPKTEPKSEPTPTKVTMKKGNLSYASWSGKVNGGKPVGFGSMSFTAAKTLHCSNGNVINAQAGDKIENAEFDDDGYLYQGTWIKSNGQTKRIMP